MDTCAIYNIQLCWLFTCSPGKMKIEEEASRTQHITCRGVHHVDLGREMMTVILQNVSVKSTSYFP